MRRVSIVVVLAVIVLAGAFWLGRGRIARPVSSPAPPEPGACEKSTPAWGPHVPAFWRVGVDDHPTAVTAVWWPSLNVTGCFPIETHAGGATAEALATAVRTAPAVFEGPVECPSDDIENADLYFRYAQSWERVRVHASGCALVTAAGRTTRRWLGYDALRPLAPAGFLGSTRATTPPR